MTITAQIIADSVNLQGIRLTTFQLRYPRWIHAEFLTHRMFSRNASSSRAIPVMKLIEDIERDPAIPIYWGKNQAGMQAREELTGHDLSQARRAWELAKNEAVIGARRLFDAGAHKQIVNRLLEPFSHINVVCSSTDYENFFALRRHEDAQPEIKALADAMWTAREESIPVPLKVGDWHLPYISKQDGSLAYRFLKQGRITRNEPPLEETLQTLLKVSVARCARVSYLTHEGKQSTIEEDLKLYERLVGSSPLHASPAEHQATPDEENYQEGAVLDWEHPELHGNFRGWIQYRKTLAGEFIPG